MAPRRWGCRCCAWVQQRPWLYQHGERSRATPPIASPWPRRALGRLSL
jgi:hypothetical protein